MKILQVMAGADTGGAETAFVDIAIALHEAGIVQHIVTRSNNARVKKLRDAGIAVDIAPFGGAIDVYTPYKIRKIIQKFNPDIVQTWMARATDKLPKSPKDRKYIVSARLGGYYKLKYFKRADVFVANTPMIRDYIVAQGIAPENTVHINNFADVEDVETSVVRSELNAPHDACVIVALARLHPCKALDVLIKSVQDLPDVHVWIAGDGELRQELNELAQNLKIENRIHFLGWRTDRVALLRAADMCVVPSRFEPFGNVFVQAWATKTPLICSKSDGPRQFVRDGEDGLLFDIDDVPQLKHAIEKLKSNPDMCASFIRAGYARFENEFTKEKTVSDYIQFYNGLLARADITR